MDAVAHIVEVLPTGGISLAVVGGFLGVAALVGLVIENHAVRHGGLRRVRSTLRTSGRRNRPIIGASLVVGLVAAAMPTSGAQLPEAPVGYPDLVSLPPLVWFDRVVDDREGGYMKIIAFDGYVANEGPGVLEVSGNPQIPGDVTQRIFDGDDWLDVGTPLVLFETSDDHNHFHLMTAASYELWDAGQFAKVGDASKVGFCLVDTTDVGSVWPERYTIDNTEYCQADQPDSTELHMGITPGWADLYDANTTLQWVDVSNVAPGAYYVAAFTDPEDRIVEADETNNGAVFSERRFIVTGYRARSLPVQDSGAPIELQASAWGEVGEVVFRIEEAPEHGTLSVLTGSNFFDPVITYVADPDAPGTDRFSFSARDVDSGYPHNPETVEVVIDTANYATDSDAPTGDAANAIEADELTVGLEEEAISAEVMTRIDPITVELRSGLGTETPSRSEVRWSWSDLAPGLRFNESTASIEGVPTEPGTGTGTIAAIVGDMTVSTEVSWTITARAETTEGVLPDANLVSVEGGTDIAFGLAAFEPDTSFTGTGLPAGLSINPALPQVIGIPEEVGDFEVTIVKVKDGEFVDDTTFTLRIRASTRPAFPL
ncbi:MAG: lysyl oxidase family protein [Actinomycetota bacterium]